jgi:hypothetical protein
VAAGLWVAVFRSTGGTVTATPAIPSFSSHSIFAPATATESGLPVSGVVRNGACKDCTVHVGAGGLVQAKVPSGAGKRTAYALLDLGNRAASGQVLVHDVIGFGRGETPAERVRLLQVLDLSHRVIFELVAGPDRRLYLTSPAGGLRKTPLVLATGAIVPNDGVSGVAVDVVLKPNGWLVVSVNGIRTRAVRSLVGGRTGAPRFLAAGVIGYKAPRSAGAITATHAQVSVTASAGPAANATQPAAQQQQQPATQPANPAPPLTSLSPPTISGSGVVGDTLTADPGTWSDGTATFTYAWERCDGNGNCTGIDGAASKTYDLVPADRGAFVRVRVTAHAGGADVPRASAPVGPVAPAPPAAVGAPTITGDAIVGEQLTADPGSWTDPDATFAFTWQRCDPLGVCRKIDGATNATYDITADDLGNTLLVEVTASNKGGANKADSVPTNVVVPAAPTVLGAPAISGDAMVGSTLTVDPGSWSDPAPTFTYAWERCDDSGTCTAVDGANGTTYLLTAGDVGFHIQVAVTAANAGGTGSADSNLLGPVVPQPPSVVTAPSLSGDAIVGSTLTVDPGSWSDPAATLSYVWERCDGNATCTAIDGVAGTTYVLTVGDVGFHIRVAVTAANAGGTGSADSNLVGPVLPQPPTVVTAPSLSGDAIVGSTLTVDPGSWSDPAATLSYVWERCDDNGENCTAIDGAAGGTYVLTGDDVGFHIRVTVTAANAGGTGSADSNLLGPVVPKPPTVITAPSLSGDAVVGSTLTVDPGSWSDSAATVSYAWKRCGDRGDGCTLIDGAADETYVLTGNEVGFHIQVTVTAANAGGSGSADSNLVGPVVLPSASPQPQPPSLVTPPSVSGDPIVGSTLTADPGTWSDPAATFGFAWLRCNLSGSDCTTIERADDPRYLLTGNDLGFRIQVTVTAANAGGTATAQSTPTDPIRSACTPDTPSGSP